MENFSIKPGNISGQTKILPVTWSAGSIQNNYLLHEIILENPVVTCWKIVTQLFLLCSYRFNHMIDTESPGARFKSVLIIYEFIF